MNNKLLKNLNKELEKIEEIKVDYEKKNKMFGESDFNTGAIIAIENTENHIKRAIARSIFPKQIEELKKWIGVLCEAHKCNNQITLDAIAEQTIYEMFKSEIGSKEGE